MTGLYIHIPFCASRCVYCGFYSTTLPALRDAYVDALCQELPLRAEELPADEAITTIYLGVAHRVSSQRISSTVSSPIYIRYIGRSLSR